LFALVAATQQDDDCLPMLAKVHSISRSDVNAQLVDTFPYRCNVPKVPGLDLS